MNKKYVVYTNEYQQTPYGKVYAKKFNEVSELVVLPSGALRVTNDGQVHFFSRDAWVHAEPQED